MYGKPMIVSENVKLVTIERYEINLLIEMEIIKWTSDMEDEQMMR